MNDYYKTLEIDKAATADDIKKAYRKLSLKHHPDRGGDSEIFAQINEAYETLSDPAKREQYDNPRPQYSDELGDIFNHFFNKDGNWGSGRTTKNPDSLTDVYLHLSDVFVERTVTVGKDQLRVPAGIRTGSKFRITGKGSTRFKDLPPGDLYVRINIVDPENWARDGDHLITQIEVSALDAMIGEEVDVEHVNGKKLRVKVPAGSNWGSKLRLSCLGVPNPVTNKLGDLYVIIKIVVPCISLPEQIELVKQLKEKKI